MRSAFPALSKKLAEALKQRNSYGLSLQESKDASQNAHIGQTINRGLTNAKERVGQNE